MTPISMMRDRAQVEHTDIVEIADAVVERRIRFG